MADDIQAGFDKLDDIVRFHASAVAKLVRENRGDPVAVMELFDEVFQAQLQTTDAAVSAKVVTTKKGK